MLKNLLIQNYALIADVDIDFEPGLNIITGETGAGKSILLGALGVVLGDRFDTAMLRSGEKKAVIEATFAIEELPALKARLKQQDLGNEQNELILRREVNHSGRSRSFINDTPVQLTILQESGEMLVDLHGQHEHQSLLKEQTHLVCLDEFGGLDNQVAEVQNLLREVERLSNLLKNLKTLQNNNREHCETLMFQIAEIEKCAPDVEEEINLLSEEKKCQHSEKLFEISASLRALFYDSERSIFDQVNVAGPLIREMSQYDEELSKYFSEWESLRVAVEELAKVFQTYNSDIEFQPDRLEMIQARLAELAGLKRKYQKTIAGIIQYRDQLESELKSVQGADEEIEKIEEQKLLAQQELGSKTWDLSQKRQECARQLEAKVCEILSYIGMPGARFKVNLEIHEESSGIAIHKCKFFRTNDRGINFAKFELSSNSGEKLKPLMKVASGGEISRIMLALKSAQASKGGIPVLIFDEIDSGVSGRIAHAVGRKLKALSSLHQIICITHLPQIASMGLHHYTVEKNEVEGRTRTSIRKLAESERELAVAKLLAGENISENHLHSARQLLQEAARYN